MHTSDGVCILLPLVDCLEGIHDLLAVLRPTLEKLNVSLQLTLAIFYSFIDAALVELPMVEDPSKMNKGWLCAR